MKLTVKEGKANKIHIYVDDEYRATVDSDYWYSEKYRNLKEINEEAYIIGKVTDIGYGASLTKKEDREKSVLAFAEPDKNAAL